MKTLSFNRTILAVFTVFFFPFVLVSCQKEKAPTKVDYLTDNEWKYLDIGFDSDKDQKIEATNFPHCLLDNEIEFYRDGTGIEDENTQSCPVFDPRYAQFDWVLSDDHNRITISGDTSLNFSGEFNILLLNNTHMILQKEEINPLNQQTEWLLYKFSSSMVVFS